MLGVVADTAGAAAAAAFCICPRFDRPQKKLGQNLHFLLESWASPLPHHLTHTPGLSLIASNFGQVNIFEIQLQLANNASQRPHDATALQLALTDNAQVEVEKALTRSKMVHGQPPPAFTLALSRRGNFNGKSRFVLMFFYAVLVLGTRCFCVNGC